MIRKMEIAPAAEGVVEVEVEAEVTARRRAASKERLLEMYCYWF